MHHPSMYTLLSDHCDICKYITNAFTLLKLPLSILTFSEFAQEALDPAPQYAILLCPHAEDYQKDRVYHSIKEIKTTIIEFIIDDIKPQMQTNTLCMQYPFTESDLKLALAECTSIFEATSIDNVNQSTEEMTILEKLLGNSAQIKNIRRMILQVADSNTTVLILGQSGTGKDVIANCIHNLSERKAHPFVPINCGAIPSELIESELFGNEKGAFTGAAAARAGRFELANKGTLFLDEIGDMPMSMQVKLLRVLQDRKVDRIGSNKSINVDVRIIAATNKNLQEMIGQNLFREDLFYRLNVFPIQVPNLHERKDDIPALIQYQLNKIHDRLQHRIAFTDEAIEHLCQYQWPGNIREMENFLERMVILHRDAVLSAKDLDPIYLTKTTESTFDNVKRRVMSIEKSVRDFAMDTAENIITTS